MTLTNEKTLRPMTVENLQSQIDKLCQQKAEYVLKARQAKSDSKADVMFKRAEETEEKIEALSQELRDLLLETDPTNPVRVIGKTDKGGVVTIGTPEAPKPFVKSVVQPSANQPNVGKSMENPEAPAIRPIDQLEIKRQQLELKREELVKQLEQVNVELATVKQEMKEVIDAVREQEKQKMLEQKAEAEEKQIQKKVEQAVAEETKEVDVPERVVPKFPLLEKATSRKELLDAVKTYRKTGYFKHVTLNKDTATIVVQVNKSLELMKTTERVTINDLKATTKETSVLNTAQLKEKAKELGIDFSNINFRSSTQRKAFQDLITKAQQA